MIFWISTKHEFHTGICVPSWNSVPICSVSIILPVDEFFYYRYLRLCFQAFCCDFFVFNLNSLVCTTVVLFHDRASHLISVIL